MKHKKINIGIIGLGHIGSRLFKEIQLEPIFEFDISSIKDWSFFPAAK